jgi:signal transduction histidine kinase
MELHDSLGQVLTTLKMDLEWLLNHLETSSATMRNKVRQAREKTVTLLRETKEIAHTLRPSLLDDLGLVPSLQNLIQEMRKSTDIEFHFFSHNIPKQIAPEKKTALYRVAQEALCNVIKHSNATHIFLNVVKNGPFLELSVEDDGIGFVLEEVSRHHDGRAPLGLLIMQERIVQVGGEFTAESRPGGGTHLLAEVPL